MREAEDVKPREIYWRARLALARLRCSIEQAMCEHEVEIGKISRDHQDEGVVAPCSKCGRRLSAPYGLALPARLVRRRPAP